MAEAIFNHGKSNVLQTLGNKFRKKILSKSKLLENFASTQKAILYRLKLR